MKRKERFQNLSKSFQKKQHTKIKETKGPKLKQNISDQKASHRPKSQKIKIVDYKNQMKQIQNPEPTNHETQRPKKASKFSDVYSREKKKTNNTHVEEEGPKRGFSLRG